jgi:hypothetical protein
MRLVTGPLGVAALALVLLLPGRGGSRPLSLHGPDRQTKTSVGWVWRDDGARLSALDEASLRPLGRPSARLGYVLTWAFSHSDPRLLAVAAHPGGNDEEDLLRFVNVASLRLVKRTVNLGGWTRALLWARPDRVIAVVSRCCTPGTSVAVIDPGARRVISRRELEGQVSLVARAGDALVLLVTTQQQIGPSRLDVVAADGSVRSVALARVSAGSSWPDDTAENAEPTRQIRFPGLAADDAGTHAFVLQPDGPAAEIDLRTLTVSYHDLVAPSSVLERFAAWMTPAAQAKGANGPQRQATWLGDGLLALTGTDERAVKTPTGIELSGAPAGLAIVDTRDWSVRALEPEAGYVEPVDGLLLATGSRWTSNGGEPTGMGVAAYGADRSLRFRLFGGRAAWVAAALAGRAYVNIQTSSGTSPVEVVDLASGKIVEERRSPVPTPLLGDAPVQ